MKLKKKLGGGLKKIFIFLFFLTFSFKNSFCAQILDYETEELINEILEEIIRVNSINKTIKFKLNNNEDINAFVDKDNTIHINSGLIMYSQDYVALFSVLAHEVAHIDLNHISIRTKTIEDAKKYSNLSLLSAIAGTAITQNKEFLQSTIIANASLSTQFIEFSKEQEMEADLYALKTLSLLKKQSDSIIKLLETIEKKLLEKGFSKNNQRNSTHPYFEDRILLVNNFQDNKTVNFNNNFNQRFNFIRAKFIGYSNQNDLINNLDLPYKTYADSIYESKNGSLKKSLENLNTIIKEYKSSFLLETKAEILMSHGYTKEAIKFFKKNLENYPSNYYAQIRIFENINIKELSLIENETIFENNKELLYKYYNNKNILLKYLLLAQQLDRKEWIDFINFYLSIEKMDKEIFYNKMKLFKNTKDIDLLKLINKIQNTI